MKRLLLCAFASLSLAACATPQPTLYQAAAGPQAMGFSDYRIEPGRYRVTFRGAPGASAEQVADYALRRAADLTLADGYDWFQVSERFIRQAGPDNSPRVSLGLGGGNGGYRGGVGVGLGTTFSLGGGAPLAATLEIFMGRGDKPPGLDAYDARGVRHAIGSAPV